MTERDPIVAVALARRPVPDHAPGFWPELEARLAVTPTELEGDEGAEATVIPLTDAPSRRRRRRWLVIAAGVVATAAVAAVAVAVVSDDDEGDEIFTNPTSVTTTAPAPAPTTAPAPTPTSAPTTPPAPTPTSAPTTSGVPSPTSPATVPPSAAPALEPFPGVWPFTNYAEVADYLSSGGSEYADPRLVVERFATDVIGVVDPVVTVATSSEDGLDVVVEVRTRTQAGEVNNNLPPTVVSVRRVGDDTPTDPAGPWVVTGATSEDVTVELPAAGAAVGSPMTVSGRASGYESTVVVTLYSGTTVIAGPLPTIAGSPDLGPYSVVLGFTAPSAGQNLMLVAHTDTGAEFVGVPAFAVTRLVTSAGPTNPDPSQVVSGFLTAVSSGGADEAWAMVDPAAQAAGGGRAAFDMFISDYALDLAKLAFQPPAGYATRRWSPTSENEPEVTVVTVTDELVTDDVTAMAFAVATNGKIVSTFPEQREPAVDAVGWVGAIAAEGGPLELLIPTSAVAPAISIDGVGVPIEPGNDAAGAEPQSARSFPLDGVVSGRHVVTLSFLKPDGLVHAEAHLIDVTAAAG